MKNKYLYIVLIALIVLSAFYYFNNKNTTNKEELSNFAVEDTAAITKIFIADKMNQQVILTRHDNIWRANNKYTVREDAIKVLLTTIKDVDVKSPIPKAALENQIKRLAAKSKKIEIYTNKDKPIKVYYVGGGTVDHQGTYMLLENSSRPFIMHVPGFLGYLSTRFFTDPLVWKDNSIFRSTYSDIKSVKLEYPKAKEKDFIAYNYGGNNFAIESLKNNTKASNFDTLQVKSFISSFMRFGYEAPITNMTETKRDSLKNTIPENIYTVTLTNGTKTELRIYNIYLNQYIDKYEAEFENDPDRFYGYFNNYEELVTVQSHLLYAITKEYNDFIKK